MPRDTAVSTEDLVCLLADLTGKSKEDLRGARPLAALGGWDSLAILEVMVRLEDAYGIAISPDRFQSCTRVDELIDIVIHEIEAARS